MTDASRSALVEQLRALVEQWLADAAVEHDKTLDRSGGIWAYQHEAAGKARALKQCAADLALIGSLPQDTETK